MATKKRTKVKSQPVPSPVGSVSGIKPSRPAPGPWVPAYGPLPAPLYVLGERPGKEENEALRPFVGPSGSILASWFERAGLSLDAARRWNTVNDYKIGNPDPAAWEMARDRIAVACDITNCQPSVIAAVGAYSVRWLLGEGYDMDTCHGVPIEWPDNPGVVVVPVYHPANSFYNVELAAKGQADVAAVARVLRGQQKPRKDEFGADVAYRDIPQADEGPLVDRSQIVIGPVAIDTEGSRHRPWCLSYTGVPGWAGVIRQNVPAMAEFRQEIAEFVAAGGKVLLHNAMHDLSVLRGLGIDLPPNSFVDTMVMAYLLCLEPQGLKALSWRHSGMEMSSYDELVTPANEAHALNYLLQAVEGYEWPDSEPYLVYERDPKLKAFVPKVKKPWPIQRYLDGILRDWSGGKLTKAGVEVDIRARWHHIDPEVRQPVEEVLGPMPTATLDDVPLADAIVYAARDADATLRNYPVLQATIDQMELNGILAIDLGAIPMFERMQSNGFAVDKPHFAKLGNRMLDEMEGFKAAIKVLTGAEINPNSPDQVGDLLFNQLGLTPGRMTKGGKTGKNKKPSTNDKVLEAMRFVHPVVPPILDYRECSKIKSSFCDPALELASSDQRLRGTIKITRVASGRPSMADPNLLAQPVRSILGKELRKGFVAAPGCVLGDWDLTQIEMCEMAHQSRDTGLLALLNDPSKDAHSETAARTFGLKLYDSADKKERYQNVDEIMHRYPAKRVGFGVITGITGLGLKAQMDIANATKNGLPLGQGGDPWTEGDCDGLILDYFHQYPGVLRYMKACRAEARMYGYVRDRWGRIRYLPGVYSDRSWIREEAERQSHSHKISSSAAGVMKQAMAAIWKFNLDMWAEPGTHRVGDTVYPGRHVEPLLQIYDSLVYEVEDDPALKQYWDMVMVGCMTTTTTMDVPIKAKGGWSYRWGGDN